eukprot:gene50120-61334_t
MLTATGMATPWRCHSAARLMASRISEVMRDAAYLASVELAKERGSFPLFNADMYLSGGNFASRLPAEVKEQIRKHGLRNSHLTSIAPTGTISLTADNMSSGIEPVFSYKTGREIINQDGVTKSYVEIDDYGVREFGVEGRRADDLSVSDHVRVYTAAQRYVDSSISKTCNVGVAIGREGLHDKLRDMGVADPESFEVHNSVNSPHVPQMVDMLYERLQRRGYLRRDVERMVNRDRNIFGSLLLQLGLGDAMITGTTRTYSQSMREVRRVIDPAEGQTNFGIHVLV